MSKETQRIGLVQRFSRLKCLQKKNVMFKGDYKVMSKALKKLLGLLLSIFPPSIYTSTSFLFNELKEGNTCSI
jgi:hypothetical protein